MTACHGIDRAACHRLSGIRLFAQIQRFRLNLNRSKLMQVNSNHRLAKMFEMENSEMGDWEPNELRSVFQHQWSARIELKPSGGMSECADKFERFEVSNDFWPSSYRDLFQHPHPPLPLLRLTKDFAKENYWQAGSLLPREIALALYCCSIFAAQSRLGQNISSLSDSALLSARNWLVAQEFVDESTKDLARDSISARLRNNSAGEMVKMTQIAVMDER
jgi:hypothetical protein